MSWEHRCKKCGKEFDSFSPYQPHCYDCTEVSKIKDLPKDKILKITKGGGYEYAFIFVKDMAGVLGEMQVETSDPEFQVILYTDEISALENHMGHPIIWKRK